MYKVSIIVPFYNAKKYILNIVTSLENQTYKNTEIIFENNGSTDNSKELLLERIKDNNMICVDEPNRGANLARLKGLEVSTGDYIYFCDVDDLLEKKAIEFLLYPVNVFNSDYVMANYYREKEGGKNKRLICPNSFIETFDNCKNYKLRDSINPLWNKLIKKDLLEPNMFINSKIGEDMVVSECAYLKAKNPRKINVPVYHYISHKESTMTSKDSKGFYDIIDNIKRIETFYKQNNQVIENNERIKYIYILTLYRQIARLIVLDSKKEQLRIYRDLKKYLENIKDNEKVMNKKVINCLMKKFFDKEIMFYIYVSIMPHSLENLNYLVNLLKDVYRPHKFFINEIKRERELLFYELQKELKRK